jgi:hypothetical protein
MLQGFAWAGDVGVVRHNAIWMESGLFTAAQDTKAWLHMLFDERAGTREHSIPGGILATR